MGDSPSVGGYARPKSGRSDGEGEALLIGVPKEVKDNEYRVALTPEGARELTHNGHRVLVQKGAAEGYGQPEERYVRARAEIVDTAGKAWDADMVLKVKEPIPSEYDLMRDGQILFTLPAPGRVEGPHGGHAATEGHRSGVRDGAARRRPPPALGADERGGWPDDAARGRPAAGEGARWARGVLMGGVSGVRPARVLVLGAGMAGMNSAWIAAGMEAEVIVIDKDMDKLPLIDQMMRGRITTLASGRLTIEQRVREADVLIGTVPVPGAKAPKLVTHEMVASMRPGSVIIDIAVDQGGCVETTHMTTHSDPTYVAHGVVHYAVGNMPGAVPNTSTYALTKVTLPHIVGIAERGLQDALRADHALAQGLNTFAGAMTNEAVGEAHDLDFTPIWSVIPEESD
jgi:alanine dehydrogenase